MTNREPKGTPQARNALARLRRNLAIAPATEARHTFKFDFMGPSFQLM